MDRKSHIKENLLCVMQFTQGREWLISIHLDMKWDTTYLSGFKTWYKSIYKWIEKSKCFQQDEDGKG